MPEFRGPKNILLQADGAAEPHVTCEYDYASSQYVAVLSAADAKKYGPALIAEGMTQAAGKSAPEPASTDA